MPFDVVTDPNNVTGALWQPGDVPADLDELRADPQFGDGNFQPGVFQPWQYVILGDGTQAFFDDGTYCGSTTWPSTPTPPTGTGFWVPVGGTTDQILAKRSDVDGDTHWVTPATGGGYDDTQVQADIAANTAAITAIGPHTPAYDDTALAGRVTVTEADIAALGLATNAATGQVQIAGVEMGDTGWRDVSSLLINGWTAGSAVLRRNGNMATLNINELDPSSKTGNALMNLPAGFDPDSTSVNVAAPSNTTAMAWVWILANGQVTSPSGTGTFHPCVSFPTDDPWPVTLPGTPA